MRLRLLNERTLEQLVTGRVQSTSNNTGMSVIWHVAEPPTGIWEDRLYHAILIVPSTLSSSCVSDSQHCQAMADPPDIIPLVLQS